MKRRWRKQAAKCLWWFEVPQSLWASREAEQWLRRWGMIA